MGYVKPYMKKTTSIALGALILSVALPLSAFAHETLSFSTQTKGSITGTVTAVSGTSVTFQPSFGGTFTIDSTNATIKSNSDTTLTVSDLKAGDKITVMGTITGSIAAETMKDHTRGTKTLEGRVVLVSGSTVTLVTKGLVLLTVSTTGTTTITKSGQAALLSDLTMGTLVKATGMRDSSGKTLAATSLELKQDTTPLNLIGVITAKTDNGVTIAAKNGTTYTLDLSSATILKKNRKEGTQSDLKVGDRLQVKGASSLGSTLIKAQTVFDLSLKAKAKVKKDERNDDDD